MKQRISAIVLAALMTAGTAAALAQTGFPDVPDDHPRAEDIEFVAGKGWFEGRSNGSFSPEARITPSQMATVLERAFPEGMTRAEFASFLRGGNWRVGEGAPTATTTTTAAATTTTSAAARGYWDGVTCELLYTSIVRDAYNEHGHYDNHNFTPDQYSWNRDNGRRFGINNYDIIRVTGWYKRFVTSTALFCQGKALLENAETIPIVITGIYAASDGTWHNYVFPTRPDTSCAAAKSSGNWTLKDYNRAHTYQERRDPDRDRIMCEGIIPEHDLLKVGDAPTGQIAL